MPYLSALEVRSRRGAIQIDVYLYHVYCVAAADSLSFILYSPRLVVIGLRLDFVGRTSRVYRSGPRRRARSSRTAPCSKSAERSSATLTSSTPTVSTTRAGQLRSLSTTVA